jgi:hypothetical protein
VRVVSQVWAEGDIHWPLEVTSSEGPVQLASSSITCERQRETSAA